MMRRTTLASPGGVELEGLESVSDDEASKRSARAAGRRWRRGGEGGDAAPAALANPRRPSLLENAVITPLGDD